MDKDCPDRRILPGCSGPCHGLCRPEEDEGVKLQADAGGEEEVRVRGGTR